MTSKTTRQECRKACFWNCCQNSRPLWTLQRNGACATALSSAKRIRHDRSGDPDLSNRGIRISTLFVAGNKVLGCFQYVSASLVWTSWANDHPSNLELAATFIVCNKYRSWCKHEDNTHWPNNTNTRWFGLLSYDWESSRKNAALSVAASLSSRWHGKGQRETIKIWQNCKYED
jgi:hypothetical protein